MTDVGLQDQAPLNDLIRRVNQRFMAADPQSFTGGDTTTYVDPRPYVHAAGSPIASPSDTIPVFLGHTWRPCTIYEMQYVLHYLLIRRFWRKDLYPEGYAGYTQGSITTPATLPADCYWTQRAMADHLGYLLPPTDDPYASQPLWRRKEPRTVVPALLSSRYGLEGLQGVTTARDRQGRELGTCPAGAIAQLYDGPGLGIQTPAGGRYRGVVRHEGGGVWVRADRNATADVLDSNAGPWKGPDWCYPGFYVHGDYYGPWLWEDPLAAVDQLRWTWYGLPWVSRDDPPAANTVSVKSSGGMSYRSIADAVASWSASLVGAVGYPSSARTGRYTDAYRTPAGPDSYTSYALGTTNGRTGGLYVHPDIPGTIEVYVEGRRYYPPVPVDWQGVDIGLVEDAYALVDSRAASGDGTGRHYVNLWDVEVEPPHWGDPAPGTQELRGFAVTEPMALGKWEFED